MENAKIPTDLRTLEIIQGITSEVYKTRVTQPVQRAIKHLVIKSNAKIQTKIITQTNKPKKLLKSTKKKAKKSDFNLVLNFAEAWALDRYLSVAIESIELPKIDKAILSHFLMILNQKIQ